MKVWINIAALDETPAFLLLACLRLLCSLQASIWSNESTLNYLPGLAAEIFYALQGRLETKIKNYEFYMAIHFFILQSPPSAGHAFPEQDKIAMTSTTPDKWQRLFKDQSVVCSPYILPQWPNLEGVHDKETLTCSEADLWVKMNGSRAVVTRDGVLCTFQGITALLWSLNKSKLFIAEAFTGTD